MHGPANGDLLPTPCPLVFASRQADAETLTTLFELVRKQTVSPELFDDDVNFEILPATTGSGGAIQLTQNGQRQVHMSWGEHVPGRLLRALLKVTKASNLPTPILHGCRDLTAAKIVTVPLSRQSTPDLYKLWDEYFPRLLLQAELQVAAVQLTLANDITAAGLDELTALPLVTQRYRCSTVDDDTSGYWRDGILVAFDVETDDATPSVQFLQARTPLDIERTPDDTSAPHLAGYRFSYVVDDHGRRTVTLDYLPHTNAAFAPVAPWHAVHRARALALWRRMLPVIHEDNQAFVNGTFSEDA